MAQVLNEFDFKAGRTGGHEKYPWADWFDGRIWELEPQDTEGVTVTGDFPGTPDDFRTTCYSAAKRRGVEIRTSANKAKGTLVVQKIGDLPGDEN